MKYHRFTLRTGSRTGFIDITAEVGNFLRETGAGDGLCSVFVPHTTAGVTVNEAADPAVRSDMVAELDKIIPFDDGYSHIEGNSAAHIKASLIGSSVTVPVISGSPDLGTWQGIFFCEFDGPRTRSVSCCFLPSSN